MESRPAADTIPLSFRHDIQSHTPRWFTERCASYTPRGRWPRYWDNVVVIMIALALVMYADRFAQCCRAAAEIFGALLLPATLIASVIGDGVHNAGARADPGRASRLRPPVWPTRA